MKSIFFVLFSSFVLFTGSAQTWNMEVGNNLTRYVFTNSAGNNPDYLKSSSGLHLSLSRENKLSKINAKIIPRIPTNHTGKIVIPSNKTTILINLLTNSFIY